ncbi:hypothetical protein TNCV_3053461 [Trichonephila clavipes]|uniref:Uncharacterized protein n=1 Tax=Trichonephila clavipes TaxID=2585209 RepID=A0A8X6VB50_TRICX|nr:hypothetical protein TNCV_3053461 [Trichonephila clavipes]
MATGSFVTQNYSRSQRKGERRDSRPHLYVRRSHSIFFKDMEVCAAIQHYACPDYQASAAVIVYSLDIGKQVVGSYFSSYESTARTTG